MMEFILKCIFMEQNIHFHPSYLRMFLLLVNQISNEFCYNTTSFVLGYNSCCLVINLKLFENHLNLF